MIALTITGADERTNIDDLIRLADLGAEIGILYTFDPEARHRYPRREWIAETSYALKGRAAIHVCGRRALAQLFNYDLNDMLDNVMRFQVNGVVSPHELNIICRLHTYHLIITQHTDTKNGDLLNLDLTNHQILVDASGGTGKSPERWVRPATIKRVGFAGGLGPANLATELPKIAAVAGLVHAWVDMESGVRDGEDWFDIGKAMECVAIWQEWRKSQ